MNVGIRAQRRARKRTSAATESSSERPNLDDPGSRVRKDGGQHFALRTELRGSGPDRDEHRETLEAIQDVGKPPERSRVGPMSVVNREQQRIIPRQVAGEPVEAVQGRELTSGRRLATDPKNRLRQRARTFEGMSRSCS